MEDLISIHAPREGCDHRRRLRLRPQAAISIHAPREGCDGICEFLGVAWRDISIHAPREGCDSERTILIFFCYLFQSTHPARGATIQSWLNGTMLLFQSTHPARGATRCAIIGCRALENFNPRTPRGVRQRLWLWLLNLRDFNPRTPRGVRQQTLPKSREFAWLNLLICTRGRRLSIRKQTRLCSMKLSFMLFGCEPAGEGVSSWTSHATKSKVRLEGRSAYSQSVRSSAHSDFPGNKSGGCPVRDP